MKRFVGAEFQLYLFFFKGQLPILAGINTQLQKSNQDLFTIHIYQKMKCFMQIFLEPILKQKGNCLTEKNVRVDIDNIEYPGEDLVHFRELGVTSGQLSEAQLRTVLSNMYQFVVTTGKALES